MDDLTNLNLPPRLEDLEAKTLALGFQMASNHQTGSILRTLAASKRSGRLLELGTGTGISTSWILDGMDKDSRLTSIDNDETALALAQEHLGSDQRVSFSLIEGLTFLSDAQGQSFDFIFADTWPGKFEMFEEALSLLGRGGFYIIDDMLPLSSWPDGHRSAVFELISHIQQRKDLVVTKLSWSTGLIVSVKQ